MEQKRIILASGSPRRREMLEQIGLEFEIKTSNAPEVYHSREGEEIVKELALGKAEHVENEMDPSEYRNLIILGADTIVVEEGKVLGKPENPEHAEKMLESLQGKAHQVYTGVAVIGYDEKGCRSLTLHAEETKVFVHSMSKEEIREYVKSGEPLDKAGAYGIQGRFGAFIDRIEGDYYNVVGLPLSYVYRAIQTAVHKR